MSQMEQHLAPSNLAGESGSVSLPLHTSSGQRSLASNLAQRRQRPVPQPLIREVHIRNTSSTASNDVVTAISAGQVVSLVQAATNRARREAEARAADVSGSVDGSNSGITLDLSQRGIGILPDETVDIFKQDVERLALSNNLLTSLPKRFSLCLSLRYLNARNNRFENFPRAILSLESLEILDLGRNKLRSLPDDIAKLASLKILAIQKNVIQALPTSIANMTSLQVVKFADNPLSFPPADVLQVKSPLGSHEGLTESEMRETTITSQIKDFFRQAMVQATGEGHSDESGTLRSLAMKRTGIGRFPIRAGGSEGGEKFTKALSNKTSVSSSPSNSRISAKGHGHDRMLSQHSTTSSTAYSTSSLAGRSQHEMLYIRRLSVLPIYKQKDVSAPPTLLDAARRILFSVYQTHSLIQAFASLATAEPGRHSSIDMLVYNTNACMDELQREINGDGVFAGRQDPGGRDENVQKACLSLINAYIQVCVSLMESTEFIAEYGDPCYIRSLLVAMYGSIVEMNVLVSAQTQTPSSGSWRLEASPREGALTITTTGRNRVFEIAGGALERSGRLVSQTLPKIYDQLIAVAGIAAAGKRPGKGSGAASEDGATPKAVQASSASTDSLLPTCAEVIRQAAAIRNGLSTPGGRPSGDAANANLPTPLRALGGSAFLESWISFSVQLQKSQHLVQKLSPSARSSLRDIRDSMKETISLMSSNNRLDMKGDREDSSWEKDRNAPSQFRRSPSSRPLTPLSGGGLSPALQAVLPHLF